MAVFSRLASTLATAYASQALSAMVFVPQQNDKYFDVCGSVGWISTACISLYGPALKAKFWDGIQKLWPSLSSFPPHKLMLTAAVAIWSLKLGGFLVMRAIKSGGDSRFDEIKKQPLMYSLSWFGQATWVALVGLPVWLVNTSPARLSATFGMRDYVAIGIYIGGLVLETYADYQKSAWRKAKDLKQHNEKFISSGLWSISRHPNYVGEVAIWTGISALSTAPLGSAFPSGTVAAAAISPLVTWVLLRKVTGIPILERAGDEKFSDNPDWRRYKSTVPIFLPLGGVD